MKKNFLQFVLLAVAVSAAVLPSSLYSQTPGNLTLEDTIKLVLKNNLSIIEASDGEAIANARVQQTRTHLYPSVGLEAEYNRIGPAPSLTIPDLGSFQLFPHDNYDVHVAGHYLLYDFNRTKETVRLAQTQVNSVKDRVDTIKNNLVYQISQMFYTILFLQENIVIQNEHIRILNEHLTMAQKKMKSGTATELEVLTTQVRLTSAESQAVELQSNLEKQQIALRKLMGLPTNSDVILKGEFFLKNIDMESSQLINTALTERVEIKTVNHSLETAKVQLSLARLTDKPSLSLNLVVGVKDGYVPDLTKPFVNFVAGFKFEMPFFDAHRGKYLENEANANIKMIEDRKRDIEETIKSEVLQALKDVQTNRKKLEMLDINIKLAEKAVSFALTRYEAGTVTNLDVLDAEEARTDAQYLRLQALYRCVLSDYSLKHALGLTISN